MEYSTPHCWQSAIIQYVIIRAEEVFDKNNLRSNVPISFWPGLDRACAAQVARKLELATDCNRDIIHPPRHLTLFQFSVLTVLAFQGFRMADRPQDQSGNEPEAFSGKMEWLYDTLDSTTPQTSQRSRRGFPCGTLLLLFVGLLILAGVAFLLLGPPLPAAVAPLPTNTPTATVTLPTPAPTVTPVIIPSPTPSTTPLPAAAFAVGDRVVIASTGPSGVRLRAGAGLDFITQGIYNDGDPFFVMPGSDPNAAYPVASDGYTWWRVRAADGLIGWIAQEFLQPAPLVVTTPTVTATP